MDIPCESNFSYKAHAKSVDPSPAIAQEDASIINIEQHKLELFVVHSKINSLSSLLISKSHLSAKLKEYMLNATIERS